MKEWFYRNRNYSHGNSWNMHTPVGLKILFM